MTVSIISSGSINSSQFADSLSAGGTGLQMGTSEVSLAAPIKTIWIRHDGAKKITNLSIYLKAYQQTYGGEYSAEADLLKAIEQGNVLHGFQIDFDWDGVEFAAYTIIDSSIGTSLDNAIEIPVSSICFNNAGTPIAATSPVQGELGQIGNTTLGDRVKLKVRWRVPVGEVSPGRRQIDLAYVYNFTT